MNAKMKILRDAGVLPLYEAQLVKQGKEEDVKKLLVRIMPLALVATAVVDAAVKLPHNF